MRALIIGGTGFIGSHVARELHSLGHDVTVYHRGQHEPELPGSVRHVRSSLAAHPVMEYPEELRQGRFDVVLHMTLVSDYDTRAMLKAFAGRVGRIVVVSSGDVYEAYDQLKGTSPPPAEPHALLTEDAPTRRERYPYGRLAPGPWGELRDYDKLLVEQPVIDLLGTGGVVLRLPMVYGPGDRQHRFWRWLVRMFDRRPAILLSRSEAQFRFTHEYVENVAHALTLAVLHPAAGGHVYNVGEHPTPTTLERVQRLARVVGWDGNIVQLPDDALPQHLRTPFHYVTDMAYDTSRIRGELGCEPPVLYEEGLRRTVESERKAPGPHPSSSEYATEAAASYS